MGKERVIAYNSYYLNSMNVSYSMIITNFGTWAGCCIFVLFLKPTKRYTEHKQQ